MKMRRIACSVVAVALLLGRPAGAQSAESAPAYQTPVTFGFSLGLESPTGFGHVLQQWGAVPLDLVLQIPLRTGRLAVRGDVMLHNLPGAKGCLFATSLPPGNCGPLGNGLISGSIDLVGRLNEPSKRWSPYALVGAAAYMSNGSDTHLPAGGGLQAGVGFEVRTGKRTVLFAEYRFMAMGTGGVAPMTIGMRF